MKLRWLVRSKEISTEKRLWDGSVEEAARYTVKDEPVLQVWLEDYSYWEDVEIEEEHEKLEFKCS